MHLVIVSRPVDHLLNRKGLSFAAGGIARLEPRKAELRIVGLLLFGSEDHEPMLVGQRRPSRAMNIARRRLSAPVQHHGQGRRGFQGFWYVNPHSQRTWI